MASRREMYEDAIKKIRPYIRGSVSADLIDQILNGTIAANSNTGNSAILDDDRRKSLDPIVDLINGGYGISELLDRLKASEGIDNISSLIRITGSKQLLNGNNSPLINGNSSYSDGSNIKGNIYLEDGFLNLEDFKFYPENNVPTKEDSAITVFELLDSKIGTAIRDTIGISIFTSLIPPHIASRAVPYVSIKIMSPTSISTNGSNTIADSLSLIRYLKGKIEWKKDDINSIMFANNINGNMIANAGGMELFTSPQTLISDIDDINSNTFLGTRPVDRFRPLMTLTSMDLEQVSAGAGLMSYKQGKLEFVLHDRGRLSEISQFVKPGAYASVELEIEYGWSIDPNSGSRELENLSIKDDVFAQFIDSLKIVEKYIVVNSTFNFDDTGQVNISSTISMKGAQDIKSLDLSETVGASKNAIAAAMKDIQKIAFGDQSKLVADVFGESIINSIANDESVLQVDDKNLSDIRKSLNRISTSQKPLSGDLLDLGRKLDEIFKQGGSLSIVEKAASEFVTKLINDAPVNKEIFFATEDMLKNKNSSKENLISIDAFKNSMDSSDYQNGSISLGRLLLLILGKPLKASKKFDEIHFIFNKVNDRGGFVRSLSLASFPLDRKKLQANLNDLFKKNTKISLVGLLGVIGIAHVNSMTYPAYGFAAAYNDKGELEQTGNTSIDKSLSASGIYDRNFVQPRLSIVTECVPGVLNPNQTILRIHVTDAANQPYLTHAEAILAMRSDSSFFLDTSGLSEKHPLFKSIYPNDLNPDKILKYRTDTIQKMNEKGIIIPVINDSKPGEKNKSSSYNIDLTKIFRSNDPKKVRDFMSEALPIIKYGGAYGLVRNITVSSISDPALATINVIAADEAQGSSEKSSKNKGLPLIVNPTEISVEMLGCPLVNFGQSFYIDLASNTSADNIYACVGINHKISPGEFTTTLKLVMNVGAYGIYNSSARKIEMTKQMLKLTATTNLLNTANTKLQNLVSGVGDLVNVNYNFFNGGNKKNNKYINLYLPSGNVEYTNEQITGFVSDNTNKIECYQFPSISMKSENIPDSIVALYFNSDVDNGIDVNVSIENIKREIQANAAAGRRAAAKKRAASAAAK